MQHIQFIHTILYVNDQQLSTEFYTKLFRQNPELNVPGMTEFQLAKNFKLGLMPNKGIAKILADKTPHPGGKYRMGIYQRYKYWRTTYKQN